MLLFIKVIFVSDLTSLYDPKAILPVCMKNFLCQLQLHNENGEIFTLTLWRLSFIHTNSCTFSYNYVSVF